MDEGGKDDNYDISDLTADCSAAHIDQCPFQTVPVTVSNTGAATSDFVVLCFIAGVHGLKPYPIERLVSYRRLHDVTAGQGRAANLTLTLGSLGHRDEAGNLVLYPSDYSLFVDVPTQATWNFTLEGEPFVLDEWPQDTGA